MRNSNTPPSDDLVQQLRKALQITDAKEFIREVTRIRRAAYPEERRGADQLVTAEAVFAATEKTLKGFISQKRSRFTLDGLIQRVRTRIGKHKNEGVRKGDLFAKATLRPYVRWFVYFCWDRRGLPPHFFDKRQPDRFIPQALWKRDPARAQQMKNELSDAVVHWLAGTSRLSKK